MYFEHVFRWNDPGGRLGSAAPGCHLRNLQASYVRSRFSASTPREPSLAWRSTLPPSGPAGRHRGRRGEGHQRQHLALTPPGTPEGAGTPHPRLAPGAGGKPPQLRGASGAAGLKGGSSPAAACGGWAQASPGLPRGHGARRAGTAAAGGRGRGGASRPSRGRLTRQRGQRRSRPHRPAHPSGAAPARAGGEGRRPARLPDLG